MTLAEFFDATLEMDLAVAGLIAVVVVSALILRSILRG